MFSSSSQLHAEYVLKVSPQNVKKIGIGYIRIRKSIVLIERYGNNQKIHTLFPLSLLLNSCFINTEYIESVRNQINWSPEEVSHSYQAEQHLRLIEALQKQ